MKRYPPLLAFAFVLTIGAALGFVAGVSSVKVDTTTRTRVFEVGAGGVLVTPGPTVAAAATAFAAAPTSTPRPPLPTVPISPPTPAPSHRLALVSVSCTTSRGYVECKGFVKNLSAQTISYLRVNIIWFDDSGVPQDSDFTFADYTALLPGQESPWSTFANNNPALKTFRVEFEVDGRKIPYRDDRPPASLRP